MLLCDSNYPVRFLFDPKSFQIICLSNLLTIINRSIKIILETLFVVYLIVSFIDI
jgi:hypothetical protein